ncbi:tRNA (adenosine(37)-N6)-threonylcarbamoyltransferase complex dimerization subunit type 1 TsaB [Pleionea sp. CnH1-48]|uniref:tRNA (adenosine(37)-N6)-threonylcarbamoyltransferase complex dimerization subunit type 1 TsaB n=1 Tax=Pleionea sp. CnH1-48 TaxID=2954494 RepID=UPI00209842AA|nr:tRNA (adenosine(37)-N6)-threonylcarbamoyltransferase complex dimerization subunit type 1 TsaB [Pleionea sp. CnH1-48]MCO7222823.1 tRNA (adenosine(37)-N6)-threonylcarbamoyltransferase complex dimerization subunit type 1 TsaB [Pleionea sp. CnH1-48]
MTRLALDTSTEAFSVAIEHNGEIHSHFEVAPRKHAELLLPTIQALLTQVDTTMQEVDLVVYGRGPGAFTGVRIAISAAQGLALGADCDTLGVSSLMNLAHQAFDKSDADVAACAIDARMGEVYFALYERGGDGLPRLCGKEQVVAPDQAAVAELGERKVVGIGSGWSVYQDILTSRLGAEPTLILEQSFPDAAASLFLASFDELLQSRHAPEQAVPVYLRDNVAKKSSKQVKK